MNLVVAYNPKSGSALPKKELKKLFDSASITVNAFVALDADTDKKLRRYCRKGNIIAVIGGDGTIGSIATMIYPTRAVLAPLPGGTLNHFTKDVGISQDLATAIRNLKHAKRQKIDIASVNGKIFLNNSSIGIYPTTLVVRSRFEDRFGKWPAAIISNIRALMQFRIYTVTINDKEYRTPFVFIGNNFYNIDNGGERSSLNKGKLSVYIIKSSKRSTVFKLLILSILGRARKNTQLINVSPQQLTIHTHKKMLNISTDGELVRLKTPLTYEILSGALTILA